MKLLTNKFLLPIVMAAMMIVCTGCHDKEKEQLTVEISLSVTPFDVNFSYEENDTQTITITTGNNINWSITTPQWLSASSTQGTGNATVKLRTKSDNNSDTDRIDTVEVTAQDSDGNSKSCTVEVKQDHKFAENCWAQVEEQNCLILTYGFCCYIATEQNTNYYKYKVFKATDSEYLSLAQTTDLDKAVSKWESYDATGEKRQELIVTNLEPSTRYVVVTVSYSRSAVNGVMREFMFETKSDKDQPMAGSKAEDIVPDNVDGNDVWRIAISKNGDCASYNTFVCVHSSDFSSIANYAGNYGEDNQRNGTKIAWNLKLKLEDPSNDRTQDFPFYNLSGARQTLFKSKFGNETFDMPRAQSDKFMEVVVWGKDGKGEWSGIVHDVIYQLTTSPTGELKWEVYMDLTDFEPDRPLDSNYSTTVSVNSLSFTADSQYKSLNVYSNEDWTASSDASWCTLSQSQGSGDTTLRINVTANTSTDKRTATIKITGKSSNMSHSITVEQQGIVPILSVSTTLLEFDASGGSSKFTISCNTIWSISYDDSWSKVTTNNTSTGIEVTVNVNANNTRNERTSLITVSASGCSTIYVTIKQKGIPNEYDFEIDDFTSDKNLN